jgi:glycosyltransferase involved in cell wall biosynthesis
MSRIRVLVVAAPFVSRGGVYTSLRRTLPLLPEHGVDVGVLWGSRVAGGGLPGTWVRRIGEPAAPPLKGVALTHHLRQAVAEWQPDVLLSVLPQSDVACSKVAPKLGVPWLAMIRSRPFPTGDEAHPLKKLLWFRAVTRAYPRATWRIAVSKDLAADVTQRTGIPIDEVIYNGVDLAAFDHRERSAEPPVRIGFVGRLAADKAPLVLCDVAAELDHPVHIMGDGALRPAAEERAAQDTRVHVHGWVPSAEAMAGLDVVVMPSIREGFGNVVLEAGASGAAFVGRAVGGIPEIVDRDPVLARHCLVPPEATPADFARAIEPLLRDGALRLDLARRLHALVASDFTVEHAAGVLARVVRETAAR